MDDEQIEDLLYPAKLAKDLGFQSLEHFKEFKQNAQEGAIHGDSSFIHFLGKALLYADTKEAIRLIWAFKDDFEWCAMAWRMHEAKQKATSSS